MKKASIDGPKNGNEQGSAFNARGFLRGLSCPKQNLRMGIFELAKLREQILRMEKQRLRPLGFLGPSPVQCARNAEATLLLHFRFLMDR